MKSRESCCISWAMLHASWNFMLSKRLSKCFAQCSTSWNFLFGFKNMSLSSTWTHSVIEPAASLPAMAGMMHIPACYQTPARSTNHLTWTCPAMVQTSSLVLHVTSLRCHFVQHTVTKMHVITRHRHHVIWFLHVITGYTSHGLFTMTVMRPAKVYVLILQVSVSPCTCYFMRLVQQEKQCNFS